VAHGLPCRSGMNSAPKTSYSRTQFRIVTTAAALALAVLAAGARPAHAAKIVIDENTNVTLSALLQPQAAVAQDAAPDGSAGTDFFLRRARLIVGGQLGKIVSFFVDTEQANLGKDGNWETSVFVQDAFVSLAPTDFLTIDAGMMLIPFTRHDLQSAAALNGIDYHSKLIQFAPGSNKVWRDAGVQVRADVAGGIVQLRGGVFNGVEGTPPNDMTMTPEKNGSDLPRVAGHARYNILGGAEKAFFYPGIAFSDHPMLSVGVGADWQKDAVAAGMTSVDHLGLAADVFLEYPTVTDQEIVFQASGFKYDDGAGAASTGFGFFSEAGYRIGWIEPIGAIEHFDGDAAMNGGDFNGYHLGAAAFIDKHKTNVKLDFAVTQTAGGKNIGSGTLQAQLYF
jgi:hypothetical protein